MKWSHWSLVGFVVGLIFAIGSFIRYYIIYPDISEAVIGISIGVLIMAISFLYNAQMHINNKITAIEDYISDKKEEI